MRPRSTAASNPPKPDAATVNDSKVFLSLPVLWRSGSKSPRRAPSTAAEANSAEANPPSSAIAIFFTDFALSQRTAAPTSRRISAELKRSALPAPAKRTRGAATPATLCSRVCSSGLPVTSPESYRGPAENRVSFCPSKTGTIRASASICSMATVTAVICITSDCATGGRRRRNSKNGNFPGTRVRGLRQPHWGVYVACLQPAPRLVC